MENIETMQNDIMQKITNNQTEMKKYDNSVYYENFKKKHNMNEKINCDCCGGSYSYFNKSNHIKSQKHQNALKLIERYKQN